MHLSTDLHSKIVFASTLARQSVAKNEIVTDYKTKLFPDLVSISFNQTFTGKDL